MRLAPLALLLLVPGPALAESRPALDDFYDRTRSRDDGFDTCIGYCSEHWLAGFLIGAQTANPSTDAAQPQVATGARLGIDLAMRGSYANIARTKLWSDVLRVNSTGDWITDLAWQTTAFAATAKPGEPGLHLSLDTLVAQRTELEPSDLAQLQRTPYRVFDAEAEVAPTANMVDKDAFWTLPIGIANRLRWSDDMQVDRRTSISGAVAFRGFPNGLRHHYQLDLLRVKYTNWDVDGGGASSWTVSAGYQRLSPGIEELQIWLLAGYEHAGERHGPIVQLGAEITLGNFEFGPALEEHLELDPRTAELTRVYQGRFYVHHKIDRLRWGLAYEAVLVEDSSRLHALTPELGVHLMGLDLVVRYRLTALRDDRMPGAPRDRFHVALDRRF
ncbi:MAG: hypothetical protein JWP01_573 [Myxococcales bacterium]|nr:hypothetical protein [Myxococcales bacterium]